MTADEQRKAAITFTFEDQEVGKVMIATYKVRHAVVLPGGTDEDNCDRFKEMQRVRLLEIMKSDNPEDLI